MNIDNMLNIIKEREKLITFYNKNKDYLDEKQKAIYAKSIIQIDYLIKKLKKLNYKLLFIKTTPFNYSFEHEYSYDIDPCLIEVIDEVINILKNKKCYNVDNIPTYTTNNKYINDIIENSIIFFKTTYPFLDNKIDQVFNQKNILLYKKSLLYKLSQKDLCIGQTFYNFINDNSYIILEQTNTINDIYTQVHEAMHAFHLKTTNKNNNYEFAEVIAYSTAYYLNDFLKNNKSYLDELKIKEDLLQDLIIYKIINYSNYTINNNKEKYIIYKKILETILPFTIYLKDNKNKDITKKLIEVSGNTNMLKFDYNKINIKHQDIIESSKLLKK